jgi:TonB-dependent receptor
MKPFNVVMSCGVAAIALVASAPANAQERVFDIPAQTAVRAIPEFARQAQIQIVAPARDLEGIQTPAIKGTMDARAALRRLIAGTPLQIDSDNGQIITLRSSRASSAGAGGTVRRVEVGTISGQVLDPATGEYLRDARVRVVSQTGEESSTTSGDRGEFRLLSIPAGTADVTVSYTGYADRTIAVAVRPGETIRQDFDLVQGEGETAGTEILVSAARYGDARAIMAQRQSMDIKNSLSVESYGEIAEGNPAEFLKYMPGVGVDTTVDGTARYVGLRGMPSEYTAVTINGINVAGTDANPSSTGGSRSFSWEQSSLSNLESIEISKTVSADVDANAPAGTINLRTRRAFDRKGRSIVASVSASTHEDMWDSASTGPNRRGYGTKFLPNVSLQYSDVFLDRRLGVVASFSRSNTYIEQETVTLGRSYTPATNATGSRDPFAVTSIAAKFDTREVMRQSASLNLDFKATDNLILSLTAMANDSNINAGWATYTLTTGARTTGVEGDAAFDMVNQTPPGTNTIRVSNVSTYKIGSTRTLTPSFEWNGNSFRLDGNLSYSRSKSHYDPAGEIGSANQMGSLYASGDFSAARSDDLREQDWTIAQVSGSDWSDTAAWTAPDSVVLRTNSGASGQQTFTGGAMNFTYWADIGAVPFEFKTGFKHQQSEWDYEDTSDADRYLYVGEKPFTEFLESIRSEREVSFADLGVSLASRGEGTGLYLPDNYKLFDLYNQNPNDWVPTSATSATEWYRIHVGNSKHFQEAISALYFMSTADFTDRLKVRAGLRWEQTSTEALEFDPVSAQEVTAAGYEVSDGTGLATTIEGMEYQFLTNPRTERKGKYDHFFPSASLKYSFDYNIDLKVGYSRTIRRPEISQLTGVWRIDEINQIITAPNPNLQPEVSSNLSVRLAKYFEPVGLISVNYFQNRIKGLIQTSEMTAQEFGYTGTEYADYTFRSTQTVDEDSINIHGWEFEFNHAMDYLPGPLSGLTLRGSYTKNNPEIPVYGMADKLASISASWKHGPARLDLNTVWNDDKARTETTWWEAFFRIGNLLDEDVNVIEQNANGDDGNMYSARRTNFGRSGAIGIRARF